MKIRGTTKCNCGREFVIQDINGLKDIDDKHFYGGVVRYYSEVKCPNCGKKVILLIRQKGQTYEVVDTAVDNEDKEVLDESTEETSKDIVSEFVCPECEKELKSKSGLTSHLKTHNK